MDYGPIQLVSRPTPPRNREGRKRKKKEKGKRKKEKGKNDRITFRQKTARSCRYALLFGVALLLLSSSSKRKNKTAHTHVGYPALKDPLRLD